MTQYCQSCPTTRKLQLPVPRTAHWSEPKYIPPPPIVIDELCCTTAKVTSNYTSEAYDLQTPSNDAPERTAPQPQHTPQNPTWCRSILPVITNFIKIYSLPDNSLLLKRQVAERSTESWPKRRRRYQVT